MKIILDTNVLYSYKDINSSVKTNTRIRQSEFLSYLSSHKDDLYISSVTLYELLIHFKNDTEKIKEYIAFLRINGIEIIFEQYFPIPQEIQNFDLLCNCTIKEYIEEKILPVRIEVESRFQAFYIMELSLIYLINHLDDSENHFDEARIFGLTKVIQERLPELIGEIGTQLNIGYFEEKQEQAAKKVFYKQLCSYVVFIDALLKFGSDEKSVCVSQKNDDINPKVDMKEIYDFFSDEVKRFNKNKNNLTALPIREISKQKGLSKIQIDFMDWIIQKMGDRKGFSFKKNDIEDMLISNVLNDSKSILISWDDDLISFLKFYNPPSYGVIDQVYQVK
jgi:predicted nucleic acid-binding protein